MVSGRGAETGIVRRDGIGVVVMERGYISEEDVGDARARVGIEDGTDRGTIVWKVQGRRGI
jgi:hypothetical protein